MAHFIVTFRIANDSDYRKRYDSFVERVRYNGGGLGYVWEETTAFFALQATSTAEALCSDLWTGSAFDSSKDQMVVIDLDNRKKATKGPVQYLATLAATLGF